MELKKGTAKAVPFLVLHYAFSFQNPHSHFSQYISNFFAIWACSTGLCPLVSRSI
jgi:hypothetical protein